MEDKNSLTLSKKTTVSRNAFFSTKRYLEILSTYPVVGKFTIQQSEVQQLLFTLIVCRLMGGNLSPDWVNKNKSVLQDISEKSLGQLKRIFTPSINKVMVDEKDLMNDLGDYIEKRNRIIHPRGKDKTEIKILTGSALELGSKIEGKLVKILNDEDPL